MQNLSYAGSHGGANWGETVTRVETKSTAKASTFPQPSQKPSLFELSFYAYCTRVQRALMSAPSGTVAVQYHARAVAAQSCK